MVLLRRILWTITLQCLIQIWHPENKVGTCNFWPYYFHSCLSLRKDVEILLIACWFTNINATFDTRLQCFWGLHPQLLYQHFVKMLKNIMDVLLNPLGSSFWLNFWQTIPGWNNILIISFVQNLDICLTALRTHLYNLHSIVNFFRCWNIKTLDWDFDTTRYLYTILLLTENLLWKLLVILFAFKAFS